MFKSILRTLKDVIFETDQELPQAPTLPPPSREEQKLIDTLRKEISSLPPLIIEKTSSDTDHKWLKRLENIRKNILEGDPRTFLYWPDILATMYTEAPALELEYVKSLPQWNTIQLALEKDTTRNGNSIHHAYHLSQILTKTNLDLTKIQTIFEFGGGYGNMARIIYKMGFTGTYIIFDLPEFTAIQKYYLSSIGMMNEKIILISNYSELEKRLENKKIDLMIGTWSISESPLELRKKVMNLSQNSNYILLGYQALFSGIDNMTYFKDLTNMLPSLDWNNYEIEHLKGNYYLVGTPRI